MATESPISTKYKVEHNISGYGRGVGDAKLGRGGNKFTDWVGWSSITAGVAGFVENRTSASTGIQLYDPDILAAQEPFRMGRFILKIVKYPAFFPPIACEMARWLFEDQVRGVDGITENSLSTITIETGTNGRALDFPGMYKEGNKDLNLKVPEWKGRPLGKFIEWWIGALSDPETGVGTLYGKDLEYVRPNYGMSFLYIIPGPTLRPEDIEFSCLYHECWPTKEINGYLSSNTLGDAGSVGEQDVNLTGIYQKGIQVDSLAQVVVAQQGLYNETYRDVILPSYFYKGLLGMTSGELEEIKGAMSVSNIDRINTLIANGQNVNGYTEDGVMSIVNNIRTRAMGDVDNNPASPKNQYPYSKALENAFLDINERASTSFTNN